MGKNPLFFHGIVLFIVAALLLTVGITQIVAIHNAQPATTTETSSGPGGVQGALQSARQTEMDINRAKSLTTGGAGSISGALYKAQTAADLGKHMQGLGVYLPAILWIVLALGTAAAGLFVIWQANWARYAGFAIVFLTLLYYTWLQAGVNSDVQFDFQVWRPLVLVVLAALGGKFLFDMWVEKFEAA
jgi:hypothetical protein